VYDSGTLAIGDANGLAFYDQDLRLLREIPVDGGCHVVALLASGRALCETPGPYSASVVSTYAIDSGVLLATSTLDKFAEGAHLNRVPGVEALVTSPMTEYLLYDVATDGTVSLMNMSAPQTYMFGMPFAFWGSGRSGAFPAHLVAGSGSLLKIYDPDCLGTGTYFDARCFGPDGQLGTQWGDQTFAGMVNDGQDSLFTVSTDYTGSSLSPSCAGHCLLAQQIDLPSRRVLSSRLNSVTLGRQVLTIAHDAECGMLLVSSFDGFDTSEPQDTEYYVDLIDYGAP
jgi:hypothetical protein